jgi:hypothetical protein
VKKLEAGAAALDFALGANTASGKLFVDFVSLDRFDSRACAERHAVDYDSDLGRLDDASSIEVDLVLKSCTLIQQAKCYFSVRAAHRAGIFRWSG